MKSNRHVSHLGGLGSGDGLSTSLNQDMNPPKISGGGFEGTADANFSKNLGQLRVHIDDEESLMFPDNENIEMSRDKDLIRGKVPFQGKYKLRENKSMNLETVTNFINQEIVPMLREKTGAKYLEFPEISSTKWMASFLGYSMPSIRVYETVFEKPNRIYVKCKFNDMTISDFDREILVYNDRSLLEIKHAMYRILDQYKSRRALKESKENKKKLIDLFNDKYFEEDIEANEFKEISYSQNDKDLEKELDIRGNNNQIDYNNRVSSKGFKMVPEYDFEGKPKTSIEKINEMVKKEVFYLLKEQLEDVGLTLKKKSDHCSECGYLMEACSCNEESIEEMNVTANIAGYTTKLSTPKNIKKHNKNMLPTGYKIY